MKFLLDTLDMYLGADWLNKHDDTDQIARLIDQLYFLVEVEPSLKLNKQNINMKGDEESENSQDRVKLKDLFCSNFSNELNK